MIGYHAWGGEAMDNVEEAMTAPGTLSLSFLGHGWHGEGLKHILGHAVSHVWGGEVMEKAEKALDDFKDTFPLILDHVGLGEGL